MQTASSPSSSPPRTQERSERGGDSRTGGIDVVFGCDSAAVAGEEGAGGGRRRRWRTWDEMVASVSIHYFIRHMCRHVAARDSSAFSAASSASSSAAPVFPVVVRPASAEHAAEMERLISQLPLFTLASSLAVLLKSSRARCRHPLLLRAISGEEGDCRRRTEG
uniref:Uncharacterized protein n=1 Tax=Oryza rufipogon TaxID=4529 RepID=A0A0E0QI57_ORYRU